VALDTGHLLLPPRLHERFPRLREVAVSGGSLISDALFADFALTELAHLPGLTALDLNGCIALGAPSFAVLQISCSQLQELNLSDAGALARTRLACRTCLLAALGVLKAPA
jgi:hypothetical protein